MCSNSQPLHVQDIRTNLQLNLGSTKYLFKGLKCLKHFLFLIHEHFKNIPSSYNFKMLNYFRFNMFESTNILICKVFSHKWLQICCCLKQHPFEFLLLFVSLKKWGSLFVFFYVHYIFCFTHRRSLQGTNRS